MRVPTLTIKKPTRPIAALETNSEFKMTHSDEHKPNKHKQTGIRLNENSKEFKPKFMKNKNTGGK